MRTMVEDVSRHYREIDLQRRREGSPPVPNDQREEAIRGDSAQIYNFIGAYYIYNAWVHESMYELALSNFTRAVDYAQDWYLPYENMGDVYSYTSRQRQALLNYDRALALTERITDQSERTEAVCRIRIAKGLAQLQSNERLLIEEAHNAIEGIKADCIDVPRPTARLLYDFACWHAIAVRLDPGSHDARSTARLYLAASLARDRERELWAWAELDPDIHDNIREGLDELKLRLEALLSEVPELPGLPNSEFWPLINLALAEVGWP